MRTPEEQLDFVEYYRVPLAQRDRVPLARERREENRQLLLCVELQAHVHCLFWSSLEVIGRNAFYKNTNLTSISFGTSPSLTSIGEEAFYETNLASVVLPDSVSIIEPQAFAHSKLTSVVLPDSVSIIKYDTFGYTLLTSVKFPASLKRLSGFCSTRLTSVIIPGSVTRIDYYAFTNTPLNYVTFALPASVTFIDSSAFENTRLTSLTIPDSVTHIGYSAFKETNITSLAIPDSVTHIDDYAFQGPVHSGYNHQGVWKEAQLSSNPRLAYAWQWLGHHRETRVRGRQHHLVDDPRLRSQHRRFRIRRMQAAPLVGRAVVESDSC